MKKWEGTDAMFTPEQIASTGQWLIHGQIGVDEPHAQPPQWWLSIGRARYRALRTDIFQCAVCDTLCEAADLMETITN